MGKQSRKDSISEAQKSIRTQLGDVCVRCGDITEHMHFHKKEPWNDNIKSLTTLLRAGQITRAREAVKTCQYELICGNCYDAVRRSEGRMGYWKTQIMNLKPGPQQDEAKKMFREGFAEYKEWRKDIDNA